MQKQIQRSNERGGADHGWLKANFSFSFGQYYNPEKIGFGKLLVLNDDTISAKNGFGMHPHKDMEIITIVTQGELEHKDNIGEGGILKPGDIQVISAGTGVIHSEYNHSKEDELKLFDETLKKRDSIEIKDVDKIEIEFNLDSEILIIDVPY